MGFQKVVNAAPAVGTPGIEVNPGQAIYTAENYLSDGTVLAGRFVFAGSTTDNNQEEGAAEFKYCSLTGTTLLGFAERHQSAYMPTITDEAISLFNEGISVPVAIRGQFYMEATGAATEGQAVLCDPATGDVTYGTAGDANDTGWIVHLTRGVDAAAEGDLIIVENFG